MYNMHHQLPINLCANSTSNLHISLRMVSSVPGSFLHTLAHNDTTPLHQFWLHERDCSSYGVGWGYDNNVPSDTYTLSLVFDLNRSAAYRARQAIKAPSNYVLLPLLFPLHSVISYTPERHS